MPLFTPSLDALHPMAFGAGADPRALALSLFPGHLRFLPAPPLCLALGPPLPSLLPPRSRPRGGRPGSRPRLARSSRDTGAPFPGLEVGGSSRAPAPLAGGPDAGRRLALVRANQHE